MPEAKVIKIRLSLNGRPLNAFKFSKDVITVGRDQSSDIFVDNPGVSREHLKFELTPAGEYRLVDLGSANGTYLNDERVKAAFVRNNDLVRFAKFTLWIGLEPDLRKRPIGSEPAAVRVLDQATTVLSPKELERLMSASREKESQVLAPEEAYSPEPAARSAEPSWSSTASGSDTSLLVWVLILIVTILGAGATWLLLQ